MSDYEVIFGLDCVGGDQAPIDCAVVKTNDGKPGIMLDGEVFTKDSLTPEPAGDTKILVSTDSTLYKVGGVDVSSDGYALGLPGDVITGFVDGRYYTIYGISQDTLETTTIVDGETGLTSFTIPEGYVCIQISAA